MTTYKPLSPKNIDFQAVAEAIVRMAPTYRAPYVSVIGYSEALLEGLSGPITDPQRDDIEAIRVSGWEALSNLNDILDVMLLMSGEIEYEKESFSVQQMLNDVLRDVKRTYTQVQDSLPLQVVFDLAESVSVVGDERRLRQAILGLVNNAIVTEPMSNVLLTADIEDNQQIKIQIQDNCHVSSVDDYTYFFEPSWMSKLESGKWRQMQWQSYLAHHFVDAHQGEISVGRTEPTIQPVGTVVIIQLPLASSAAPSDS